MSVKSQLNHLQFQIVVINTRTTTASSVNRGPALHVPMAYLAKVIHGPLRFNGSI